MPKIKPATLIEYIDSAPREAHEKLTNFMPTHSALVQFKEELTDYKVGKDTIQFPYDKPLPAQLISKIASFRVKDVRENDALWMYKK